MFARNAALGAHKLRPDQACGQRGLRNPGVIAPDPQGQQRP